VNIESLRPEVRWALEGVHNKQALNVTVLDLAGLGAFAECFLLCSASSSPQMGAIADEVERKLESHGRRVAHREGRAGSEWMLLDYGGLVVHILTERAREFYDLERLWRDARRWDVPDPAAPVRVSESGG
jgi:ribosome-associated protein